MKHRLGKGQPDRAGQHRRGVAVHDHCALLALQGPQAGAVLARLAPERALALRPDATLRPGQDSIEDEGA